MKPYRIERTTFPDDRRYNVIAPNDTAIAFWLTWRSARKIADALNAPTYADGYAQGFIDAQVGALNAQQVKP